MVSCSPSRSARPQGLGSLSLEHLSERMVDRAGLEHDDDAALSEGGGVDALDCVWGELSSLRVIHPNLACGRQRHRLQLEPNMVSPQGPERRRQA